VKPVRRDCRVALIGALIGLVALGCAGVSAFAAGPRASSASVGTLNLKLGDQLYVKGARLACVVQKSGVTINFVCVKGTLSSPIAGGYGVGIADKAADLAAVSANSAKVVKVVQEPAVAGATFPVPARKPHAYTLGPTVAVLIGGTHIFCALQKTDRIINVTCGLSSIAAGLQYPPGTYAISLSARTAILFQKKPKGQVKTIAIKAQP
jgi:hypothetical protein